MDWFLYDNGLRHERVKGYSEPTSSVPEVFIKVNGSNIPQACNFIRKETLVQVFFCEFCEIAKNPFFTEYLWMTASFFKASQLYFSTLVL